MKILFFFSLKNLTRNFFFTDRRLSRKNRQLSLERLKRSLSMGMISEPSSSPKPGVQMPMMKADMSMTPNTIPTDQLNEDSVPETILEESSDDETIRRRSLSARGVDFKHVVEAVGEQSSKIKPENRTVFNLSALKTDEGLGESFDQYSEKSDSSPKCLEKNSERSQDPVHTNPFTDRIEPVDLNQPVRAMTMLGKNSEKRNSPDLRTFKKVTFL